MRSGELARLAGVSADTIRYYERLGLLQTPSRTPAGYRQYSKDSVERVRLIRRALGAGFSLAELAAILKIRRRGDVPCKSVFLSAVLKRRQLDARIKELQAMRRELDLILKQWQARLALTPRGRPAKLLENLPQEMENRAHAIYRDVRRNFSSGGRRPAAKHRPERP
jgi:DNA-binding transcriptional MerR regulator